MLPRTLRFPLLVSALVALALPAAAPAASTAKAKKKAAPTWISLGDSYAVGYQPGAGDTDAFAKAVTRIASKRHRGIEAVQLGCGGENSTSFIQGGRFCAAKHGSRSQLQVAEAYLRKNRGRVAFVTVSIGGNDVTSCLSQADVVGCAFKGVETTKANLPVIAKRLRAAAGPKVEIVGITYPDVVLASYLKGDADFAKISQEFFRTALNPAIANGLKAGKAQFVDVTTATGGYTPFEQTTALAPYGEIPVAVANVCRLTWMCSKNDIHANDTGYRFIAQLVGWRLGLGKKPVLPTP